jgi:cytochrome c-type biogenesis protein CcmH
LIAQVEDHLSSHPDDGRGWEVIAPVYLRLGRFDDAVKARRNALKLSGTTAERESALGEALVFAANGVVTAEAKAAFERAIALDANGVQARYCLDLAAEQDSLGRREFLSGAADLRRDDAAWHGRSSSLDVAAATCNRSIGGG